MAKTGWQDRAPYMSSPETDALLSAQTDETRAHVQGVRPTATLGLSTPAWFGSYSEALYAPGAEFIVPPEIDWGMPHPNATKQFEKFENAEYNINKTLNDLKKAAFQASPDMETNARNAIANYKKEQTPENLEMAEKAAQELQNLGEILKLDKSDLKQLKDEITKSKKSKTHQ